MALWVLAACGMSSLADPPKEQPASKEKEKAVRPTTKEEFAALAKDGPKPPWLPFTGQQRVLDERIRGTVVEVSADAIEVRPKGKKETVKFPPHVLLATGAVCHWETDSTCYLLDDVQKGDFVLVSYGTVDKEKGPECFYVSIQERPGGVVPPSRKPSDTKPYHLDREYELFYERKGEKTPEALKSAEEKRKFLVERGVPLTAAGTREPPKKDEKK